MSDTPRDDAQSPSFEELLLYCRRGYVLAPIGTLTSEKIRHWTILRGRRSQLHLHPETPWRRSLTASVDVTVIGTVMDPEDSTMDSATIGNRLLKAYTSEGERAAVGYASYLAGRFVLVIETDTETVILGDAHQTLAAFWTQSDRGVFVASHSVLVAEMVNSGPDEDATRIMNSGDYFAPGGKYYPAKYTPYAGITQMIANCLLRVAGSVTHERFYPTAELEVADPEDVYEQFSKLFSKMARAWASVPGTGISLTAGLDSRVTLSAATSTLQEAGGFATTYYKFGIDVPSSTEDVVVANRLAWERNLPHRIAPLKAYVHDESIHTKSYAMTFPKGAQFPARAVAYMDLLHGEETLLISTIAETGTVFYKERDDAIPSAARLAQKFSPSAIRNDPQLLAAFEEYIDYTDFRTERMHGFDYHDLFYWEHRNSKWAAVWYSECDLAHAVALPFNQRRLIELMLSLPLELRESKFLLKRFIDDNGSAVVR